MFCVIYLAWTDVNACVQVATGNRSGRSRTTARTHYTFVKFHNLQLNRYVGTANQFINAITKGRIIAAKIVALGRFYTNQILSPNFHCTRTAVAQQHNHNKPNSREKKNKWSNTQAPSCHARCRNLFVAYRNRD